MAIMPHFFDWNIGRPLMQHNCVIAGLGDAVQTGQAAREDLGKEIDAFSGNPHQPLRQRLLTVIQVARVDAPAEAEPGEKFRPPPSSGGPSSSKKMTPKLLRHSGSTDTSRRRSGLWNSTHPCRGRGPPALAS